MTQAITLALSKGRIFDETLPLLKAAGVVLREEDYKSRKLYMPTSETNLNILILRATDVPTFVEHGAADLGVVGKDVLMEHGGAGLYEPLDLQVACCRLMVAQPVNYQPGTRRIKVATKYINIAKQYFARKGQQVEVIKLYGSMELAPVVGLADKIVDVVDTGSTLKANGLEPTELIAEISSRLVVNKAAMKLKHTAIQALIDRLALAVGV